MTGEREFFFFQFFDKLWSNEYKNKTILWLFILNRTYIFFNNKKKTDKYKRCIASIGQLQFNSF